MKDFIYAPPADTGLEIIYQDDHLLVLNKPSGLLSVPGRDPSCSDCLEARAQKEIPGALIVHRLDRGTSGVFLMAMNKKAQASLGKQFERRRVRKSYIALLHGRMAEDTGEVDLPLVCDWPNRPRQKICHETGRAAQTGWEVLERGKNSTRVRLTPHTGRSHQLRVHMLSLGHPIIGDTLYGPPENENTAGRLLLHAETLTLHHPDGGRLITFAAPCPF